LPQLDWSQNILDAKVDETGPESANNLLKALRLILDFAVHKGLVASNPAHGLKRYKSQNPDGHHMWSEDEIARYEAVHPLDSRAGLALALLVYTGQRRGDILGMGWQHVQGGSHIVIRQQKTGVAATIPIHPKLALALAALSKTNLTFLVTTRGTPFSTGGFNHWFRRMCGAAGLPPECTPHGLRKSALTRLGEAGCSVLQIAAISGHKSFEVQRYTEGADKRRLADQAMAMQLRAEGEQSLPATPTHALPNRK
jgi:integrase